MQHDEPRALAEAPPTRAEFDALHGAYAASVWDWLRRLGVHEAALDDAVRLVFVGAHRRFAELRQAPSQLTFLLALAQQVCCDLDGSVLRARRLAPPAEPLTEAGKRSAPRERDLARGLAVLHTTLSFAGPAREPSVPAGAAATRPEVSGAAEQAAHVSGAFPSGTLVGARIVKLYLVVAMVIGVIGTVAVWRGAPAPSRGRRVPSLDAVAAERALIDAAEHSLSARQPALALHQLEQIRASGPLHNERAGLRALALCSLGRVAEGAAARDDFLAHSADTPLALRVRNACQ